MITYLTFLMIIYYKKLLLKFKNAKIIMCHEKKLINLTPMLSMEYLSVGPSIVTIDSG